MGVTNVRLAGPALVTNAAATKYVCPDGTRTKIKNIHVCNTSASAATFTFSIGSDATGTRIFSGYSIAAHSFYDCRGPFIVTSGEILQAFSGTNNVLTLTVDGTETSLGSGFFTADSSGRFIRDPAGAPFLISSQFSGGLTVNSTPAQWATYLDQLLVYGFNTIAVELVTQATWAFNSPFDDLGQLPFLLNTSGAAWDGTPDIAAFDSPNDDYFAYAKSKFDLVAVRGMLMRIQVLCWGFRGSQNGWWRPTGSVPAAHNTVAVHTGLGAYLANGHGPFAGFKNSKQIMWTDGGDWGVNNNVTPESTGFEDRPLALANAMIANGCTGLRLFDGQAPSLSSTEPFWNTPTLTSINGSYTYGGVPITNVDTTQQLRTYELARLGFQYTNANGRPVPCFLRETAFAHSPFVPGDPIDLRYSQWWHYLSGGTAGTENGDEDVWPFNNFSSSMAALTSDVAIQDMARMNAFLPTLPWTLFVPSELGGLPQLIVGARGSQSGLPTTYIAASQSSNGSCLLAYCSPSGSGAQTFSINLTSMGAGALTARWWDPTAGTFTAIGGSFDNTMNSKSVTTPGLNSAGETDWLVLIQQ